MNKIYVIAGTAREATDWIKGNLQKRILNGETPIGMSEYAYVTGVDTLRGIRNPHGVFVGSWKERLDIFQIVEALMLSSIYVNHALSKVYNEVKPKVRPTPKTYSILIDEAAELMAREIDAEVLRKLTLQSTISSGNEKMNASELVIHLHDLARETKDSRIRMIADNLAEVAKDHSDKGYQESTLEKQAEFARKRNYHYTNTDNPKD
jgi:hypothetical protein